MSERKIEILKNLKIETHSQEIFLMSGGELRKHFGFKSGGVDSSRLIRNLIWQDRALLEVGLLRPFRGNLRSYWYRRVKPVLARARAKKFAAKYPMMIRQFVAMIVTHRLADYGDFGFSDESSHQRTLGGLNGHVLCVAEKVGHRALLEELRRLFGVSVYALGGQPSARGSESLVSELRAAGLEERGLVVVSLVDYDPSGASIIKTFLWQLKQLGFEGEVTHHSLVHPSRMSSEQIKLNKFPLPRRKSERKKNARWANQTGGLEEWGGGRLFGLEVDAMTWEQVIEAFGSWIAPHLQVPADQIKRLGLKNKLAAVLREILISRIFR